ncbi:MAG TPA: threonine synthase [Halothiobacillaceae bacterium]|nr:threonine synthase [Halothiobacillaceae bacterium]
MIHHARYTGLLDRYRDRLPLSDDTRLISLGEGATPLIRLQNLPKKLGRKVEIYAKYEGLNPTGSFKDRGMTMAVTKAVEEGSKAIICASTGNTSAAAAAYAARAGITAFVIIPDGKIAMGKLAQAMMYGAKIMQIRGNFDDGMRLVKEVANHAPVAIVNSVNPYRLQGQKTAAFEIIEELGRAPDYHCLPVGNAGNITAHWIGYCEYIASPDDHVTGACDFGDGKSPYAGGSITGKRPKMLGYQATGSAPFMRGEMIDNPETVATAIRIGHPQSWDRAWKVVEESGGWFAEVSDEEILAAQRLLTQHEGVFCEPASAASLAGLINDLNAGKIEDGSSIVLTLTGNGLKDPDTAIGQCNGEMPGVEKATMVTVDADLESVRNAITGFMD